MLDFYIVDLIGCQLLRRQSVNTLVCDRLVRASYVIHQPS
jgi:hypothetical protein